MEQIRGINKETGEWVYGFYAETVESNSYIITSFNPNKAESVMIIKESIGRFTGKYDNQKHPLFQGDIIISQLNGVFMTIQYGEYQAFCPVDKEFMTSIGFYASAIKYDYPDMPLGPTEEYAVLVGNMYNMNSEKEDF